MLDPSGNHGKREGFGTTGWALFVDKKLEKFGVVKGEEHLTQERYWHDVWQVLVDNKVDLVVCESYRLFAHKAQQQSGSSMDTPGLIGFLRMMCWYKKISLQFQNPKDKVRVNDEQLVNLGVFEHRGNRYFCNGVPIIIHARDAVRHGIFYYRYGGGIK